MQPIRLIFALTVVCGQYIFGRADTVQGCYCTDSSSRKSCTCTESNVTSVEQLCVILSDLYFIKQAVQQTSPINLTQVVYPLETPIEQPGTNYSFEKIENLSVIYSGLTNLEANSFSLFPNLKTLSLIHNYHLNSYGEGAFESNGPDLTILSLRSNPVRSLARGVFKGLSRLELLDLSDNRIGYLETGTFTQNCCSHIRELRLAQNILTALDAEILMGLSHLEVLDLRQNPLQQPDINVFAPCASTLMELYLSHDDRIPFGGFNTPTPEELKLTNVTKDTFNGLSNLQTLSLRGNRLGQLTPDVFTYLKLLERLDLSGNRLVCLPSSLHPEEQQDFLAGLHLHWIDLSWNRLTHLNHLTARSLSLFDTVPNERPRLLLNLTGNPWQQIDEDTFCNPQQPSSIRPTDLIVGPAPNTSFGVWRISLGLWYARARWPDGPFATIGHSSRVFGLLLDDESTKRVVSIPLQESRIVLFDFALIGAPDSQQRCQQLKLNDLAGRSLNSSSLISKELEKIKLPSATLIAFSISSYCPRLPVHKLEDWELSILQLSQTMTFYNPLYGSPLRALEQGSRLYLLVIVAVCVAFLLTALTAIMCYRAWSRRTSQKVVDNHLDRCLSPVTAESVHEKQLLLLRPTTIIKPTEESPTLENLIKDEIGGIDRSPISIANGKTMSDCNLADMPVSTVLTDHQIMHPALISRINHVRGGRPKSDSEANGFDDTHKLTAFGVV
ncbi:TLR4 interactor with leucine rich repeat [Paragonimus heterotremus]|uniref:TLR4 interactor with leucine rich repeat n=1 Tax=Paragonimus heterotremus TaxID=100268 RepID=A0A8J4TE33_9TREM|nr:TLR4 interactor with leucine rich repeat [Paragonimus heterotremus]